MSKISVTWDNEEKTILRLRFENGWTWEDFHHASHATQDYLLSVSHPVSQIMDFSQAKILPANLISQSRTVLRAEVATNLQQTIIVGANAYLAAMLDMLKKVLPKALLEKWNMNFVKTVEDAYKLLDDSSAVK